VIGHLVEKRKKNNASVGDAILCMVIRGYLSALPLTGVA
jgi:hypothetical protein